MVSTPWLPTNSTTASDALCAPMSNVLRVLHVSGWVRHVPSFYAPLEVGLWDYLDLLVPQAGFSHQCFNPRLTGRSLQRDTRVREGAQEDFSV